jgi:hypothetical protein
MPNHDGDNRWPPPRHGVPASLVLFDVSTQHFETGAGDRFREPGFCKERRLEPQITEIATHHPWSLEGAPQERPMTPAPMIAMARCGDVVIRVLALLCVHFD